MDVTMLRACLALLSLFLLLAAWLPSPVLAQDAPPAGAPPMRVIIEVPNDAAGRSFMQEQVIPKLAPGVAGTSTPASAPPTSPPAPVPAASGSPMADLGADMSGMVADDLSYFRTKTSALIAAVPTLPDELGKLGESLGRHGGPVRPIPLLAAFLFFSLGGYAARKAAFWSARGQLAKLLELPGDTPQQRLRILGIRVSFSLYILGASVLGSLGAFLLFPWPPVFREMVLIMLGAFVVHGLALAFGRVVIAPAARHDYFRVLPLSRRLAQFWFSWWIGLVDAFAIGGAALGLLRIAGLPELQREVLGSIWLGGLAIAIIVMIWQRQRFADEKPVSRVAAVLLTVGIVVAWLLATAHARDLFWTLMVVIVLPLLMRLAIVAVRHVVRIDEIDKETNGSVIAWAVVVERAIRALFIIGGAIVLAKAWHIDLGDIAMGESLFTRLVRAVIRVLTVLLVADLAWRLTRALIDGRLDGPPPDVHDDTPEGRRRQRLRTLLPILRNFALVVLLTVTLLMVLDAIGIQIGPLLAGAGVVGIAVGFGAQTLVKDIISGVFYLLDDAFRVGEYIQTKSHKGTVESFSIRSVKLRHHRGPITTVPFGELGAVQNLSRDWVIDKVTIGVPYDTDLDLAKKIIKQIGRELMEDPELGPNILEPLKMQGVEQMGDFAIQLRLKMMTKPGEQFMIRRRAYALIKKRFEENGIRFAMPTVTVAGGAGDSSAAAARQTYEMTRARPETAEPAPG
ncbi:MAG: mechanosensitive ion channel [Alsobacter sp.]